MEYLHQIPLFSTMSEEQLIQINRYCIERSYAKGAIIFMEGSPGQGFHFVVSGKVKIVKSSDDGREHTIKILQTGEVFAEVLLFSDLPYPATAIAVESSRIGMIKNSDLEKLILTNGHLALQLIKSLSERLRYAQRKLTDLALSDVSARTADTLLSLAHEQGSQNGRGQLTVMLNMPRHELANLVGTTRESVTRTLSAMKRDGLIEFDGRLVTILQPDKLAGLCD